MIGLGTFVEHLKELEFVLSLDGCREIRRGSEFEQAVVSIT